MKKFFNEFKEFISKGNVMDMAIGVIIATAFGKITTSLVNDVFMPLIGMLIGGIDLGTLNITLSPAVVDEAGAVVKEAVVVGIGTFLTTVIDFILVAFVVFLVVKAFNSAKAKLEKPAEPEPEPAPAPQPKPAPKPNPTPKPKQQKRISYKDFLKKNPEKRNSNPQRQRTTPRKVKVGSVKASFPNINQIANISASATTGAAMKNELAAYAQYIHSMAKRNWAPPQDLYEELETEISFVVSKSGVISAFRIIRSSGNSAFDNSVATTFKSISLMPPPDKQQHTITLTFSSVD